jgi:hypothetical protein
MTRKKKQKKHPERLLSSLTVGLIVLYFSFPCNKQWLKDTIVTYYQQLPHQMKTFDIEKRIEERHGYNYLIPKAINDKTPQSAVILLPPKSYVMTRFSDKFYRWHNAIWDYYFFGSRSYINFLPEQVQDFSKVTHAILCEKQKLKIVTINSPKILEAIIAEYKQCLTPKNVLSATDKT